MFCGFYSPNFSLLEQEILDDYNFFATLFFTTSTIIITMGMCA